MDNLQKITQQQSLDWEEYSKYQGMRLWKATLLTLGIPATSKARTLALGDVKSANEYRKRRSAMLNALSEHDSPGKVLWLSNDPNNKKTRANHMVSLRSVVAFAKERQWSIPDEMHKFWITPTGNVSKRAAAEENKTIALKKILAAVVFSLAKVNSSQTFKEIANNLQQKLKNASLKMDRTTLNDHLEAAISDHLGEHLELIKQLIRPKNEKRS